MSDNKDDDTGKMIKKAVIMTATGLVVTAVLAPFMGPLSAVVGAAAGKAAGGGGDGGDDGGSSLMDS